MDVLMFVGNMNLVSDANSRLETEPRLVSIAQYAGVNMARVELAEYLQDSGGWRGTNPEDPNRCRFFQHGDHVVHALFALQSKYAVPTSSKFYNSGWNVTVHDLCDLGVMFLGKPCCQCRCRQTCRVRGVFQLGCRYSKTKANVSSARAGRR